MPDTNIALNPLPLKDNEGGALNLTRVTGLGAALVAVLTTTKGAWDSIFGEYKPEWAKPVVIIAVIGALAIVAAADVLARGYAAGQRGDLIPMPDGLVARYNPGNDQRVEVVAVRYRSTEDGGSEFLIVKNGKSSTWANKDQLDFANVPPALPSASNP